MELLVFVFFGGPFGLPLSLPPLPEDPAMLRAAPADCLWYVSLAGMAKPDPKSANHTEQLLAEAEIQRFLREIEARLMASARANTPADQIRAREEGIRLAKIFLTRPVAAFITSFDPEKREIQAGVIVNLGEEREAVVKSLILFEQMAGIPPPAGGARWRKLPGPMPVEWGTEGNYLVLGVGDGVAGALAGNLAKPGNPPAWLASLKKELAIERPAVTHYLNAKRLLAQFAGNLPPNLRTGLDAAGLAGIKHVASGTGLDATGCISRSIVALDGPPKGVLAALGGGTPLTAADLAALPADSTLALAARLDTEQLYRAVFDLVGKVSPEDRREMEADIAQAEAMLGFKLQDDLLKSLGDLWCVYNSPGEGGLVFTGATAVVSLKDRAKFAKTHDRLVEMARALHPVDESAPRRRGLKIGEFAAGPHKGYFLNVVGEEMPFAPAWCVTDRELVVSLFPQGVKAYVARNTGAGTAKAPSLAASAALAPYLKSGEGTLLVAWHDSPATFRLLYPAVQMIATVAAGQLQREGIDVDISMLPQASVIARHLGPDVAAVRKTADGFVFETRGSSPVSGSVGMMGPMMMLMGFGRGFSSPFRDISTGLNPDALSTNHLKQIGLAMHNYAAAHRTFPGIADKDGVARLSWRVRLLPYLEEQALYNKFKLDEAWDSPHNKQLIPLMPAIFKAPRSKAAAEFKTVYLTLRGKETMFPPTGAVRIADIRDGTSNTIMAVEAADDRAVIWTKPDDLEVDWEKPLAGLAIRSQTFLAALADGSVRSLPATLPTATLKALFTRAGGEFVDLQD